MKFRTSLKVPYFEETCCGAFGSWMGEWPVSSMLLWPRTLKLKGWGGGGWGWGVRAHSTPCCIVPPLKKEYGNIYENPV